MDIFLSDEEHICVCCGKVSEKGIRAKIKRNRFFLCAKCLDLIIPELLNENTSPLSLDDLEELHCVFCGRTAETGTMAQVEKNWFCFCTECAKTNISKILAQWKGLKVPIRQDKMELARIQGNALLESEEVYLKAGVPIGTKNKPNPSNPFTFVKQPSGIYKISISQIDERIQIAARFLSRFDPKRILACASQEIGVHPIVKFAEVIGAETQVGRFPPGLLTNPVLPNFKEVEAIVICDPHADKEAINEARISHFPAVISILNTDNSVSGVDLAIPGNNRNRKSLALIFFLLARQIQRERGDIPPDGQLEGVTIEDFESKNRPP